MYWDVFFSYGYASIGAINSVLSRGYFLLLAPTCLQYFMVIFHSALIFKPFLRWYFKGLRYGDLYRVYASTGVMDWFSLIRWVFSTAPWDA